MVTTTIAALVATTWAWTAAAQPLAPEGLVAEALAGSPTVASLRHRQGALRARAAVAGAWPDPLASVEYSNAPVDRWTLSEHPMSGLQLRIQQTLRPLRWSGRRRAVGALQADMGSYAVEEGKLMVALAVRRAWWSLARTRALQRLTEEHLHRTDELLDAVRSRYETGTVGQHAVLRLEVLDQRLSDELGDFERRITELEAALDQASSRDEAASYPTPTRLEALAPPAEVDWLALAEQHRPRLARLRAEERLAEEAARLARSEATPDANLWVGYRLRSVVSDTDASTDLVSLGIGLPIPTGSGRRASGDRAAALEDGKAARSLYRAAQDDIAASMATIIATWRRAADKTRVYDQALMPAARSALETARADFTVGRADFASVFGAEVELIELERARVAAAVDCHIQHAEATAVIGVAPPRGTP